MGFVGNYAPRGLSPQTDGMPVIHTKKGHINVPFSYAAYVLILRTHLGSEQIPYSTCKAD